MKVALEKPRKLSARQVPWTSCEPFVENKNAVLTHRVRFVSIHSIDKRWKAHLAVHGWCGNGATGTKKFTFLAVPSDGAAKVVSITTKADGSQELRIEFVVKEKK